MAASGFIRLSLHGPLSRRRQGASRAGRRRLVEALRVAVARDLPEDVRAEEITVLVCFRGSLALNAVTGGAAAMTFSARCHDERLRARSVPRRAVWGALAASIDLGCALLRGEAHHCEVAWRRWRARGEGDFWLPAPDERPGFAPLREA